MNSFDFSENLLNLGRLHWYLLNANRIMENGLVELDEIHWWISTQEHDIPTMRQKTTVALGAADVLKEETQRLRKRSYDFLDELYQAYYELAKSFDKDISTILEFTHWLHQRSELAPTMLFNYRTWGSTRIANRTIGEAPLNSTNNKVIEKLTLIVLGLIHRNTSTIKIARSKLRGELDEQGLQEVEVSSADLDRKTVFIATYELAEYFEQLRDSLRNILLEIDKREAQERLVTSDNFWRTFISKAARSPKTEPKYWDFKQTLSMWHIKDEPLKSEKAQKFAELVAGFANNQGGVLIVGVTDDPPRQIVGLIGSSGEIENNMKYARNVISQHCSYDKDFVHFQQVSVPDEDGAYKLCLVIVIQQTVENLGVRSSDGKSFTYPLREEAGLVWKNQHTIGNHKTGTKSDNYKFLSILQQFVNEEI
jgi:hypothetical protein